MSNWISTKDRQPDHPGRYLCRLKKEAMGKTVCFTNIVHYRNLDWWSPTKVTHWMPLPEPPKEGDE